MANQGFIGVIEQTSMGLGQPLIKCKNTSEINVLTTSASATIPGGDIYVITPNSMAGIQPSYPLIVDSIGSGFQETVLVTAITSTTFTARFNNPHTGPFPIYLTLARELYSIADPNNLLNVAKVDAVGNMYQVASVSSQAAYPLGVYQIVNPWGSARVSVEPSALFADTFDGAVLDTVNRWNTPSLQGIGTGTVNNGLFTLTVSSSANNAAAVSTIANFHHQGMTFDIFTATVMFETSPIATGNYRFWGLGTPGVSFTALTPLTDGVGFEIDTLGSLNACVWAGGTKIASMAIPSLGLTTYGQPAPKWNDGGPHRYAIMSRADVKFFFIDNQEIPVASFNYKNSVVENLPIRLLSINGTSKTTSTPTLSFGAIAFGDSGHNNGTLSDGTYPWRKATVNSNGSLSVIEVNDTGRQIVSLSTDAFVGALTSLTESLVSFSLNLNGSITPGQTSVTIPGGKTFRVQNLQINIIQGTATAQMITFRLRHLIGGGTLSATTSPVFSTTTLSLPATIGNQNVVILPFEEGVEFPAGSVIGMSVVSSAAVASTHQNILIVGYLY